MAAQMESPFETEVDVLQYALTLEHIEATFYRQGVEMFPADAYVGLGFQASVRDRIVAIAEHEASHVDFLTAAIDQMGVEPVAEAEYDFGYTDLAGFLQVAMALENTGVAAYTGAAQYLIDSDDLLTAALNIHGVEARHAAYLNLINGGSPFPDAVDAPKTPDEVLAIAGPFIVG
jgi:Ferritin-like domain